MKSTTLLPLAFIGLASCWFHGNHHGHVGAHNKKRGGLVTELVVEWVTTTVIKWVDELPTDVPPAKQATVPPVAPVAPTEAPAQFFEGATTTVAP